MDLNDLLSSLTPEDKKQLQETAAQLLGGSQEKTDQKLPPLDNLLSFGDMNMLGRVGELLSKMNEQDSRCDFLFALKPLLHEPRKQKVDQAVNILKMTRLMTMMKEGGMLG